MLFVWSGDWERGGGRRAEVGLEVKVKVWLILNVGDRSMVYIEGEASMRKFQKADEAEQQALSIVQRSPALPPLLPPRRSLTQSQEISRS